MKSSLRWVSKQIKKKFKSTVLCCAFHPTNGQLLATGSSDFKCRVFSTFTTDVDGTRVDAGPFGVPQEFGEPYCELVALGWVNSVAWSPSGNILAYVGALLIVAFLYCVEVCTLLTLSLLMNVQGKIRRFTWLLFLRVPE